MSEPKKPVQCEGWRRYGGAFTLGNPRWEQCPEPAVVMLRVSQPGETGTMPACMKCWQEARETDGITIHDAVPIKGE